MGFVGIQEVIVFIGLCRLNVPAFNYGLLTQILVKTLSASKIRPTNHHLSVSYPEFARASEVVALKDSMFADHQEGQLM